MHFIILLSLLLFPVSLNAQEGAKSVPEAFRSTPYPIPRFVSLRAKEAFVRTGPGKKYPVKHVLKKRGLPLEIILEYENWRKIRDVDGDEGWVYQSLISGRRMALVGGDDDIKLYKKPRENSSINAILKPMVLLRVPECDGAMCYVEVGEYEGWVKQSAIWGVYASEKFD